MFTDVSYAGGGSKIKVHVRAELEPLTTPVSDAEGDMRHIKESRKGVIKVDQFKGTVKIPIPSPALGITEENAEDAVIHLILSHVGEASFAECLLEFDEIETEDDDDDEEGERQAEYKVFMRRHKGNVQAKKGNCITTGTTTPVVPNALVNDVATATFGAGSGTPFLEGTFESHH
jgi:hypothetical protein